MSSAICNSSSDDDRPSPVRQSLYMEAVLSGRVHHSADGAVATWTNRRQILLVANGETESGVAVLEAIHTAEREHGAVLKRHPEPGLVSIDAEHAERVAGCLRLLETPIGNELSTLLLRQLRALAVPQEAADPFGRLRASLRQVEAAINLDGFCSVGTDDTPLRTRAQGAPIDEATPAIGFPILYPPAPQRLPDESLVLVRRRRPQQ